MQWAEIEVPEEITLFYVWRRVVPTRRVSPAALRPFTRRDPARIRSLVRSLICGVVATRAARFTASRNCGPLVFLPVQTISTPGLASAARSRSPLPLVVALAVARTGPTSSFRTRSLPLIPFPLPRGLHDLPLHLAGGVVPRKLHPAGLGIGRRHASDLPGLGPVHAPFPDGFGEQREFQEDPGHA